MSMTIDTSKPFKVTSIKINTKKIIDEMGLSINELVKKSGLSYPTIHRMLSEDKSLKPLNIKKVADALGVEPDDLYDSVDKDTNDKTTLFGHKLYDLAIQMSISKNEIARKTSYSTSIIYRMCTNGDECTPKRIKRVAESLGLDPTYFDDCISTRMSKPKTDTIINVSEELDLSSIIEDEPMNITYSSLSTVLVITTENGASILIERMMSSIRISYTRNHKEWTSAKFIGSADEFNIRQFNIIDFCTTNLRVLKINITGELKSKIIEFSRS